MQRFYVGELAGAGIAMAGGNLMKGRYCPDETIMWADLPFARSDHVGGLHGNPATR